MPSEIFRFVTIRPPQHTDDGTGASSGVIYLGDVSNDFIESMRVPPRNSMPRSST